MPTEAPVCPFCGQTITVPFDPQEPRRQLAETGRMDISFVEMAGQAAVDHMGVCPAAQLVGAANLAHQR